MSWIELEQNPNFQALYAEGGPVEKRMASLRRQLCSGACKEATEYAAATSELAGLEAVRKMVEGLAEKERNQDRQQAIRDVGLMRRARLMAAGLGERFF